MQFQIFDRVMTTLKQNPNGMTAKEVATIENRRVDVVSSQLSKLATYGYLTRKRDDAGGHIEYRYWIKQQAKRA